MKRLLSDWKDVSFIRLEFVSTSEAPKDPFICGNQFIESIDEQNMKLTTSVQGKKTEFNILEVGSDSLKVYDLQSKVTYTVTQNHNTPRFFGDDWGRGFPNS